jgi:hypothetical protein
METEQPTGWDQLFDNLEDNLNLLKDEKGNIKTENQVNEVLYNLSNALCGLGTEVRENFERIHATLQRIEQSKSR